MAELFVCPGTDLMLRNRAINKPSSQISTYIDQYGPHPSSLANDGSRLTDYTDTTYGCAASNPAETNPWWAVDLGGPTLIYQVNFTNRGDAAGTSKCCYDIYENLHITLRRGNIECSKVGLLIHALGKLQ